jgi:hypothetical protein
LLLIFLIGLFVVGLKPLPVFSAVDSCTASVSPASMRPSTPYSLTFTVNNTSSSDIVWVRVTRPSTDFSLDSAGGDWDVNGFAEGYIYLNNTLAPSGSHDFVLTSTAGPNEIAAQNWTVEVSGSSDGSSPVTCTGSLGVSISNSAAASDLSGPVISALTVSGITSSAATISFTTDKDTTDQLDYGTSISYGTTSTHSSAATSHSFSLSGLSADTTYYYQIQVTDGSSNVTTSDGNTFTTSKTSSTTTTTTTTTVIVTVTPTPTATPTPGGTTKPDSVAPSGQISNDLSVPFKESPKIDGIATDNIAVKQVEYSTDNGLDWLPVGQIENLGSKQTKFSFRPQLTEDGNYLLKIRVTDNSNLIWTSQVYTLVIDRLAPLVGANLISVGPQVLVPNEDGVVLGLANLTQKVTLAAVGGPISVDLLIAGKVFSLVKNADNGLWSGSIRFAKSGLYRMSVRSVDGAKNLTTRSLNSFVIVKNGVVKSGQKPLSDAQVQVYSSDPTTGSFDLWDGTPFGVQNPQKTDKNGLYRLFLPEGKYYLTVKSGGFNTLKTEIFTLNQSQPLNQDFSLNRAVGFNLWRWNFSLPSFESNEEKVNLALNNQPRSAKSTVSLVNHPFPSSALADSSGRALNTLILGKPTIVSFLNSWSPQALDQLDALNSLAANTEINVLAIFPQESASSTSIFGKRGDYLVKMIADPDGTLINSVGLTSVPTNLFINRQGIIRKVKVGLFDSKELLDSLIN